MRRNETPKHLAQSATPEATFKQNERYDSKVDVSGISDYESGTFNIEQTQRKYTFGNDRQCDIISDSKISKLDSGMELLRNNDTASQINDFYTSAPPVENKDRLNTPLADSSI